MAAVKTRLLGIGWHEDWRIAEMLTAIAGLVYGIWLCLPSQTFVGTTYIYVRSLGINESQVAGVFIGLALARLYACKSRRHKLRRWAALADAGKWMGFWGLLAAGTLVAALPSLFLVLGVASILGYLSAVNCRVDGDRCNGLLEHHVQYLTRKLAAREASEEA